jgi:hypothetical protein
LVQNKINFTSDEKNPTRKKLNKFHIGKNSKNIFLCKLNIFRGRRKIQPMKKFSIKEAKENTFKYFFQDLSIL